jgi:signal transduction histidine kinase
VRLAKLEKSVQEAVSLRPCLTISADTTLGNAVKKIATCENTFCDVLAVLSKTGELLGTLTSRSLLQAIDAGEENLELLNMTLRSVLKVLSGKLDKIPSVNCADSALDALFLMSSFGCSKAIVIEPNSKSPLIKGVVYVEDFLPLLLSILEAERNDKKNIKRSWATADDAKATDVLEATNSTDLFVSHVAHDIRNPISLIMSCCEMIDRTAGISSQNKRFCQIIQHAAARTLSISDMLLQLERYKSGEFLQQRPVKLSCFLEMIQNDFLGATEQRGIEIVIEEKIDDVVKMDPQLMSRALQNLIDNACKYSKTGGKIYLSANLAKSADGDNEDEMVELSVRDEGEGLSLEAGKDLFAPYVRLDECKSIEGYGLGLAIAKRFVECHGGKIRAESGDGHLGAKFTIAIPFSRASASASARPL